MIVVYVTDTPIIAAFNDRFGDLRCVATRVLPHSQNDTASAKMNNPRSALSRRLSVRLSSDFASAANGGNAGCDRSIKRMWPTAAKGRF
jgi:hypothetical protein